MPRYRHTWRHEVYFDAENDQEAREIMRDLETGAIKEEVECSSTPYVTEGFVEGVSLECESEDMREVSMIDE